MRLQPIDRPSGLLGRLMSWVSRRRLGKVIMPMRVVYNRVPRMYNVSYAFFRMQRSGMKLDVPTQLLATCWVSMVNRCRFCIDIAKAGAVIERIGLEKFDALPAYRSDPRFDDRERAALAYVEEATRDRGVSDATFEWVRKHFDEREIVELTLLACIENFYNLMNLSLGIEEDGLCALALGPA